MAQPQDWGTWLQFRNLYNYWWARTILACYQPELQFVADFGCGSGYGTVILREQTQFEVCGYDHQAEYLQLGQERFGLSNLHNWDFDGPWVSRCQPRPGAIVCFDLLEQLRHRDVFLSCLAHVLQAPGIFLCSVAGQSSVVDLQPRPPWQLFYTRPLIKDLLQRFFKTVHFADEPGYPGYDWHTNHLNQLKKLGPTINRTVFLGQNLIFCEGPRHGA